jgi:hypothetical protein
MLSVVRSAVDMWSCLSGHPGLLVPLEGLVASELDGSPSLVVVHGYVPGAVTLAQAHLQPTQVWPRAFLTVGTTVVCGAAAHSG